MGNVIPWSQIHPSIKSEAPFVGVIIVDPTRQLCVSDIVSLEAEQLGTGERAAPELIAAAQAAATRVASAYRARRTKAAPPVALRVLPGGSGS